LSRGTGIKLKGRSAEKWEGTGLPGLVQSAEANGLRRLKIQKGKSVPSKKTTAEKGDKNPRK